MVKLIFSFFSRPFADQLICNVKNGSLWCKKTKTQISQHICSLISDLIACLRNSWLPQTISMNGEGTDQTAQICRLDQIFTFHKYQKHLFLGQQILWEYAAFSHYPSLPASVAQLAAHPIGDQEVAGLTPIGSVTFFHGIWSRNIFYGHSLPSADSRRVVVSFWRKMCTILVNSLED